MDCRAVKTPSLSGKVRPTNSMKTLFPFLFFSALLSGPTIAGNGVARLDTVAMPQPDSTQPVQKLTGNIALAKSFSVVRSQEVASVQNTPWYLTGNLTLTTRAGWTIPLQSTWSSPAHGYGGNYNAIGVSPSYKNWLTLHGGHQNLDFSPFTLEDYTVLGAGFELNPGLLRVGVMAGQFEKAIEPNRPDRVAAFRRTGYCAKIGVGNDQTYLDVILLHASDDANSIQPDSSGYLTPAQNTILGLSGRIRASRKLTIELDAAGSAYTSDTRADGLPAAPAGTWLRHVKYPKLIPVNASTSIRTAVQASLNYRLKWADLRLRYKRVEPGYQSMGAYYMQNDIERITVAPTLRMFKNQLQVRGSLGWQHDNLTNQKRTRTDRLIGSAGVSYTSEKNLMLDLSVSNYGMTQGAGYRPLNDTTRMSQNNRSLSGSVFKSWTQRDKLHNLNASATFQELQDLNPFTARQNQSQNWNYSVSYIMQNPAAGLDMNISYTYTSSLASEMHYLGHGPTGSVEKKFFKSKLSALLMVSYFTNTQTFSDLTESSFTLNTTFNLDYHLTPMHRLSVSGTDNHNRGAQPFQQQQGTVRYTVTF